MRLIVVLVSLATFGSATAHAAKVRSIKDIGSFVWVSNIASLSNIDAAIESARAAQKATGTARMGV